MKTNNINQALQLVSKLDKIELQTLIIKIACILFIAGVTLLSIMI